MNIFLNSTVWYGNLADIAALQSKERYERLLELHKLVVNRYINMVEKLTESDAAARAKGVNKRTKASIVGHILAWEEWQLEVFEDKDPEQRLARELRLEGYVDPESGKSMDFSSVDDFNAYQDRKYSSWKWKRTQRKAIETTLRFKSFFVERNNDQFIEFLNNTPMKNWRKLPNPIPAGWYLWLVSLDHEAVAHVKDLTPA
jgi:hypothetical protein